MDRRMRMLEHNTHDGSSAKRLRSCTYLASRASNCTLAHRLLDHVS